MADSDIDYHSKCVEKLFGSYQIPDFEIDEKKLSEYAKKIIGANKSITGVQPKLSLWLEENRKSARFTVVNDKSNYIIKPQNESYSLLPENEDLCMHLANVFGINVAQHGLVRLNSGNLAYITKRFDRNRIKKIPCEDLCQLSESLTEHKYKGSYEKTGKIIKKYSDQPGIDAIDFFQLVLFCFVIGNGDMHLKNFSMFENENGAFCLSPAYDLVCTHLVILNEPEQLSLNLNGKKNKIQRMDFDAFGISLQLTEKQIQNSYKLFSRKNDVVKWWISNSFLSDDQKAEFQELVLSRLSMFDI